MAPDSVRIYDQFTFDSSQTDKKKTLVNVVKFFDAHFEPVKNVIYECVKFNDMKQGSLSTHQFITEVQTQADNCDYGNMKDELIRDRIVVGVNDHKLREHLIDIDDLTLHKAIQKAKQYVTHHSSVLQMNSSSSANDNLDEVRTRPRHFVHNKNESSADRRSKCQYCGRKQAHSKDKCPARNATCFVCKQKGHFSKSAVCKGRSLHRNADEVVDEEHQLGGLYLGSESE
ncbi:uncharacterized protein [Watersipora subatra]|uniref:uncharacterized protein n=1 Tax=Watersipora subatra TaxID=2589382 RepID=UPI00355AF231